MEETITQDLKQAMLNKDVIKVSVLRSLKSGFIYAKVAPGAADGPLSDDTILNIIAKEAKKRQESADAYLKAGSQERAKQEQLEQAIIEAYLPAKLDRETVASYVAETVAELGASSPADMGRVIAAVKQKTGPAADGAVIAQLVKERLAL